jgi:hypothetical protein
MLEPWPGRWKDCSAPGGKLNPCPSWRVKIKIPGLTSGAGGEIRASDAAMFCASLPLLLVLCWRLEVGAGIEGVVEAEGDFADASVVMVDWEEERQGVEIGLSPPGVGKSGRHWRGRTLGELPRHGGGGRRGCRGCAGAVVWRAEGGVEGRRSRLMEMEMEMEMGAARLTTVEEAQGKGSRAGRSSNKQARRAGTHALIGCG